MKRLVVADIYYFPIYPVYRSSDPSQAQHRKLKHVTPLTCLFVCLFYELLSAKSDLPGFRPILNGHFPVMVLSRASRCSYKIFK